MVGHRLDARISLILRSAGVQVHIIFGVMSLYSPCLVAHFRHLTLLSICQLTIAIFNLMALSIKYFSQIRIWSSSRSEHWILSTVLKLIGSCFAPV